MVSPTNVAPRGCGLGKKYEGDNVIDLIDRLDGHSPSEATAYLSAARRHRGFCNDHEAQEYVSPRSLPAV
jgi:hypothetical protein